MVAMSDLRSGCESHTQECLHFLGISENVLFKEPHKWTEFLQKILDSEQATSWTMASQKLSNWRAHSVWKDRWVKLQLPLEVAQHITVLVFPLQTLLCGTFRNSI